MKIFHKTLFLLILTTAITSCKETSLPISEQEIAIIPQPQLLEVGQGYFEFSDKTAVVISDKEQEKALAILNERFEKAAGFKLKQKGQPSSQSVVFIKDDSFPEEAYNLKITPTQISIKASETKGYLYAVQTLRLLLPKEIESDNEIRIRWVVPVLNINDNPEFVWRGLMLDVVRHFFEKEYIYKTIDLMAMLKMNVLHLHLVDDQGWRIEIKKYPKLTEIGAWRVDQEDKHWDAREKNDPSTKGTYGGFYTQDDIHDIVQYAQSRGIQVMPEIEMPAHVSSALAAYPELSCHQSPIAVPSGGLWPITDIYCAGSEEVFTFLENVLTEVIELFPFQYIHIGGDEATKTEWQKCPKCQKRIRENNLKDVHQLQTYFINRIEKFLTKNHRRLVGWDEIVEDKLSPNAVVMSWRGYAGGVKASEMGNDVIMTPGDFCYLDQYQGNPDLEPITIGGNNKLSKVYDFEPYTQNMSLAQKKHILGAEATLFSEYVTTPAHSQYMIFPRLFALSEAMWLPRQQRDWQDFVRRTEALFSRFDLMGVNYAKSIYQVNFSERMIDNNTVEVTLQTEHPDADIRYVVGNEDLEKNAIPYREPIILTETQTLRAAVFKDNKPFGDVSQTKVTFHKALGKKVSFQNKYHKNYQGQQESTLTNIVRGTKNFHDKQWLAWLTDDAIFTVDMETPTQVSNVRIGVMENQGQGIYLPQQITVFLSDDNKIFQKVGYIAHQYNKNGYATLSDFEIHFPKQSARYIKIEMQNIKTPPSGGDAWLFVDEILVN